ncbi:MAG: aminoacyl-tRNA hydrolase [Planctomycetes bacterium]|nr:aminoacyl-tRNA hydrolase [Planctomycetota bacterium]
MKLIVGLGNPGKKYINSRHNVGFLVIDKLAVKWSVDLSKKKHQGLFGVIVRQSEQVVLLKPQTYMNLSGDSVLSALTFYKARLDDLLVVVDDMALPLEQLRIRPQGSAGGHNGLQNIIDRVGDNYGRLRVGIGSAAPGRAVDHVLGNFFDEEKLVIDRVIDQASAAVECWCDKGIDEAMNRYNFRS